MEERANLDLLITLAKKNIDYEIKIAGKGPLLEKYREIICREKIDNIDDLEELKDYKTLLQELFQSKFHIIPNYEILFHLLFFNCGKMFWTGYF